MTKGIGLLSNQEAEMVIPIYTNIIYMKNIFDKMSPAGFVLSPTSI